MAVSHDNSTINILLVAVIIICMFDCQNKEQNSAKTLLAESQEEHLPCKN